GPEMVEEWREAHHEGGGFFEAAAVESFEPVPILMAWAVPAGQVTDAVYEEVSARIIDDVMRSKCDGLLLSLHGAMVAESFPDADGETLARLRRALGSHFPIITTLDLHGNISQRLVENCNAAVAYRTYPHVDQRECGRRAAALLMKMLRHGARPTQALA